MYIQVENSFLEHGEDFNAYIDYRIKNMNACHANNSARKRFHLLYLLMYVITANPDFHIAYYYSKSLGALHPVI